MFDFKTKSIVRNGWAQIRWLLTLGWARGREYPELVPREADMVFDDLQEPIEMKVVG